MRRNEQNAQEVEDIDTQSFMYQLTINNPLEKGYPHQKIIDILRNNFKTLSYIAMADEYGSAHTHHTHVFVVFSSRVRFSMLKRYFGTAAHIEKCRGTVSQNLSYIKKSGKWQLDESKRESKIEGTFEEYGTQPPDSKGKRSDMSELYQMIQNNMTNAEILAVNQDYIMQIDRLDKVRTTILMERFKETVRLNLEVIYIFGKTGTGKTRRVLEENGYVNVYRVTDYNHPFDSYTAQQAICFDEFRSSLKLKEMLLYCDIYPIELPSRYSNKFACYNKVYIVSNWELEKQYSELQREDKESWQAFLRRIHKVIYYKDMNEIIEYPTVQAYLERKSEFRTIEENEENPFE